MKTISFSLSVFLFFLISSISLVSCDSDDKNEPFNPDLTLVGKWRAIECTIFGSEEVYKYKESHIVEYKENGTLITTYDGQALVSKYFVEDGMLYYTKEKKGSYYSYEIDGNILRITYKGSSEPLLCITGMTEKAVFEYIE